MGTWQGGRKKAPVAMCRKVSEAPDGGEIEISGDGKQMRSLLHIEECLEGVRRLMNSDFIGPVNIGSDGTVTINSLADLAMDVANKKLSIRHIDGSLGVRERYSDHHLIEEKLGWKTTQPLRDGMVSTYSWIDDCVKVAKV